MGAVISLATFDFSSLFSFFCYFLRFCGRQIYKYKMKTDFKNNICHTGSTEVWISSTTPPFYDNKENSAILSNLKNSTTNKPMLKQKNSGIVLEKEHCQYFKNSSDDIIPIKKIEITTNCSSKSSTQSSVKNSVAIKNRNNTRKNCSSSSISKGDMVTTKETKHRPLKRSVYNKKNRSQNGDPGSHNLKKYIKEAVLKFDYDSGYVQKKCNPYLPSMRPCIIQNGHRPCHIPPPPYSYQINYSLAFNSLHISPNPFKSDRPLPNRQLTKPCARYTTFWYNNQALFEKTHWFSNDKKPNTNELNSKVNIKKTFTMPPVTLLPSASENNPAKQSCNHEDNSYIHEERKKTPDTNILSQDYTATTPCDLAVCHTLPQNREEKDANPVNYDTDDSFSDMESGPCYILDNETSDDDDDEDMDEGRFCSDSNESVCDSIEFDSDSDSSDDNDELEVDGASICGDFKDDLETDGVEVDTGVGISSSLFVRPDYDSDTNDDFDDEDDWDSIWSSSSLASPDTDSKESLSEFTYCTVKVSSTEEKADVSAVEEVEGSNLQKLKEANEKWNKFYGDEDFTLQEEEKQSKVQFAAGKNFCSTHTMVCWDFAYRAARKGPWIQIRIDAERFQKKIDLVNIALAPILDPIHRQCIMTLRFQQAADKIA